WYCGDELEECYRFYANLRSSLFPYLYSMAHKANATSLPVLRPLSLVYQHTGRYDGVFNEYMLGDAFLAAAHSCHIILPEDDEWYDFFTGIKHKGDREFDYTPQHPQCGALFVRAGSVVVTQDPAPNLRDYRPEKLHIHVYPGNDAEFELYEDDYSTYGYEKGEFAVTRITLKDGEVSVSPREGGYPGMPKEFDYEIILHNEDGTTVIK
ncbi:MAG: DUF5110 domain-containing protein, partial [Clostridia bacterium]|nr:DUF5110 domain-containing protein [Clostridia bacterium]